MPSASTAAPTHRDGVVSPPPKTAARDPKGVLVPGCCADSPRSHFFALSDVWSCVCALRSLREERPGRLHAGSWEGGTFSQPSKQNTLKNKCAASAPSRMSSLPSADEQAGWDR